MGRWGYQQAAAAGQQRTAPLHASRTPGSNPGHPHAVVSSAAHQIGALQVPVDDRRRVGVKCKHALCRIQRLGLVQTEQGGGLSFTFCSPTPQHGRQADTQTGGLCETK